MSDTDKAEKLEKTPLIPKSELIDGQRYRGFCRNADEALWDAKEQCFWYTRFKFGESFTESIRHPEDDDGYDLFYPWEMVDDRGRV